MKIKWLWSKHRNYGIDMETMWVELGWVAMFWSPRKPNSTQCHGNIVMKLIICCIINLFMNFILNIVYHTVCLVDIILFLVFDRVLCVLAPHNVSIIFMPIFFQDSLLLNSLLRFARKFLYLSNCLIMSSCYIFFKLFSLSCCCYRGYC